LHTIHIIRKYYVQFCLVQFEIGKDENSAKKWSQTPVNTRLNAKSDPLHDLYFGLELGGKEGETGVWIFK